MPIVDEAIIKKLESEVREDYKFSNRFERKMKRLIQKERYMKSAVKIKNISRGTAASIIIAFGVIFGLTMSVQANRVKFFETVKTIWKDSILYSYFVDEIQSSLGYYKPQYIPKGYHETERIAAEQFFSITYENEAGNMITWDQMQISSGSSLVMDLEFDGQLIREVKGSKLIIYLYSSGYISVYYELGESVYLLTADNLEIDDVCLIFESIEVCCN